MPPIRNRQSEVQVLKVDFFRSVADARPNADQLFLNAGGGKSVGEFAKNSKTQEPRQYDLPHQVLNCRMEQWSGTFRA